MSFAGAPHEPPRQRGNFSYRKIHQGVAEEEVKSTWQRQGINGFEASLGLEAIPFWRSGFRVDDDTYGQRFEDTHN
jgi:hypothetical protein